MTHISGPEHLVKVVLFTKKGKTGEKQATGQGNQGPTWTS